jgi:hypothetical protein
MLDVQVATFLRDEGFGNLWSDEVPPIAKAIFVGEEPEEPDNTITIFEDGGGPPLNTFGETRSFTVRVRHTNYLSGKTLAQQLHRALHFQQGILSSIGVALIQADTNPISLGRDENRRHVFTQTFTATTKAIQEE